MTIVSETKKCRKCGNPEASYEFNTRTNEASIGCTECGQVEEVIRIDHPDGTYTWEHVVTQGTPAGSTLPGVDNIDEGEASPCGQRIYAADVECNQNGKAQ